MCQLRSWTTKSSGLHWCIRRMAKQQNKPGSLVSDTSSQDVQEESMECDNCKSYPLVAQLYKLYHGVEVL